MYTSDSNEPQTVSRIVNIKDALTELYNNQINPIKITNILPTGFGKIFDDFTHGLPKKGLLLISAENTIRKSIFFSEMFFSQLIFAQYKCSYLSFNLKASDLMQLSYSRFHPNIWKQSNEEKDLDSFLQFYKILTESESHILEASIMSLDELETVLYEEFSDKNRIIFISDLNHIYINNKYESREDPHKVMAYLNQFACDNDLTIIALFNENKHEVDTSGNIITAQRQYLRALEYDYMQLWFVDFRRDEEGCIVKIYSIISSKHHEDCREFLWKYSPFELIDKVYTY